MTLTTVDEDVPIAGIWIVLHCMRPSFVQGTVRAIEKRSTVFLLFLSLCWLKSVSDSFSLPHIVSGM